jgi:hypothetical protein
MSVDHLGKGLGMPQPRKSESSMSLGVALPGIGVQADDVRVVSDESYTVARSGMYSANFTAPPVNPLKLENGSINNDPNCALFAQNISFGLLMVKLLSVN